MVSSEGLDVELFLFTPDEGIPAGETADRVLMTGGVKKGPGVRG